MPNFSAQYAWESRRILSKYNVTSRQTPRTLPKEAAIVKRGLTAFTVSRMRMQRLQEKCKAQMRPYQSYQRRFLHHQYNQVRSDCHV